METKQVTITERQIVVDRQALLIMVRAIDCGITDRVTVPAALDDLREPFFVDEITTGVARRDFSMNKYE